MPSEAKIECARDGQTYAVNAKRCLLLLSRLLRQAGALEHRGDVLQAVVLNNLLRKKGEGLQKAT